jgi:riboflavin biosynthesis pyrimidine reductase
MLYPERIGTMSPAGVADAHEWPHADRAWVRAVMVSTVDGSARSPDGHSGGISSPSDRLVFATIRGMSDVILVGAGTVRAEGYGPPKARRELADRRAAAGQAPRPQIAVVTRSGDLDTGAPLFTEAQTPPIVFAPEALDSERRDALESVADLRLLGAEAVDPAAAVDSLSGSGLRRIVCEGGPTLLGQVAAAGLLHELCLTVTPLLFGGSFQGRGTPRVLAGPALPDPPQAMELAHVLEGDQTLFLRYVIGA